MIETGSVVLLHLVNPTEKFWGVLLELNAAGATFRGLNVASFEDWVSQAAGSEAATLGLATTFVPLLRVERIFLDEQVGEVESYTQRFERRVGVSPGVYLDIEEL